MASGVRISILRIPLSSAALVMISREEVIAICLHGVVHEAEGREAEGPGEQVVCGAPRALRTVQPIAFAGRDIEACEVHELEVCP